MLRTMNGNQKNRTAILIIITLNMIGTNRGPFGLFSKPLKYTRNNINPKMHKEIKPAPTNVMACLDRVNRNSFSGS